MNLKFDIQKLTDQFNAIEKFAGETLNGNDRHSEVTIYGITSHEKMSEMIQRKAFELGFVWGRDFHNDVRHKDKPYLYIFDDGTICYGDNEDTFNKSKRDEADLSFFSLQSEKVTIEISKSDLDKIQNGFNVKVIK